MKHYRTITEVKQNLPEIIDRISDCKTMFDSATIMLSDIQRWCVEETISPNINHGWWTTLGAYTETLRNQMEYLAEMEYLQGLLNKLPNYKNAII